jgi:hypothetical protein
VPRREQHGTRPIACGLGSLGNASAASAAARPSTSTMCHATSARVQGPSRSERRSAARDKAQAQPVIEAVVAVCGSGKSQHSPFGNVRIGLPEPPM